MIYSYHQLPVNPFSHGKIRSIDALPIYMYAITYNNSDNLRLENVRDLKPPGGPGCTDDFLGPS